MWALIFIILLFYGLIQYTTWTVQSFRLGVTVITFSESFPTRIPKALVGRLLDVDNMSFKGMTPQLCLFRTRHKISNRRPGFPLLGELALTDHGIAFVTIRIPLSQVLSSIAIYLVLIFSQLQGVNSFNAFVFGVLKGTGIMAILGIFSVFSFQIEKDVLTHGLGSIKRYISEAENTEN